MTGLLVQRHPEVCELRLDAPPGNILDRALCVELAEAIREHAADSNLKAFLLSANGPDYSYGASIKEHRVGEVESFLPAFHEVVNALVTSHVPVIAAVRGRCLGGGFELAALSHFLIAEPSAVFAVPEIQLGVFPPVACLLLPMRLGGARAESLILSGGRLTAQAGLDSGLVTRICDEGELEQATTELLEETILPRSAAALRLATRAARVELNEQLSRRLPELERLYLDELMATRDAREGIQAFLEKREPVWVNG